MVGIICPPPLVEISIIWDLGALAPLNPTALTMKQQNVTLHLLHYLLITLINRHFLSCSGLFCRPKKCVHIHFSLFYLFSWFSHHRKSEKIGRMSLTDFQILLFLSNLSVFLIGHPQKTSAIWRGQNHLKTSQHIEFEKYPHCGGGNGKNYRSLLWMVLLRHWILKTQYFVFVFGHKMTSIHFPHLNIPE